MDHSITAEGFGVRLRPVRKDDAVFIAWLRNQDCAKGHIGDTGNEEAQHAWLEEYFKRPGDYYFIAETVAGTAVGTYGIYNVRRNRADVGRWVCRSGARAGIPSLVLAFNLAFETLALDELHIAVVSTNHRVLSFHQEMGFRQSGITPSALVIGERHVNLVHFLLDAEEWPRLLENITPLAEQAEVQVRKWESMLGRSRIHGTE